MIIVNVFLLTHSTYIFLLYEYNSCMEPTIVFYTSFNEDTLPSLSMKEIGPGLGVGPNYDPPATSLSHNRIRHDVYNT